LTSDQKDKLHPDACCVLVTTYNYDFL
jgi:hypothetical protein